MPEQQELQGIVLQPEHYMVGVMELPSGEKALTVTFWMTPDRSDKKPLTIVMSSAAANDLLISMTQVVTDIILGPQQGSEDEKPDKVSGP